MSDSTAPSQKSAAFVQADRVWNSALPTTLKLVLWAYLDSDRQAKGVALRPSKERVAWMTGLGLSTVRAAVRQLEQLKVLECVGHRGRVIHYRSHLEFLPTRPRWDETQRLQPMLPLDDRQLLADNEDGNRQIPAAQPPAASTTAATTASSEHGDRQQLAVIVRTDRSKSDRERDRFSPHPPTAGAPQGAPPRNISRTTKLNAEDGERLVARFRKGQHV